MPPTKLQRQHFPKSVQFSASLPLSLSCTLTQTHTQTHTLLSRCLSQELSSHHCWHLWSFMSQVQKHIANCLQTRFAQENSFVSRYLEIITNVPKETRYSSWFASPGNSPWLTWPTVCPRVSAITHSPLTLITRWQWQPSQRPCIQGTWLHPRLDACLHRAVPEAREAGTGAEGGDTKGVGGGVLALVGLYK